MSTCNASGRRFHSRRGVLILLAVWLALSGLAGCQIAIPGQGAIVASATPPQQQAAQSQPLATAQPQVVVVTATFTPAPPADQVSTAMPTLAATLPVEPPPATEVVSLVSPTPLVSPSVAPSANIEAVPTATADLVATQVAVLQAAAATLTAQAPPPTDTPEPTPTFTATPVPPTNTPKPVATKKPTATAAAYYPPPILMGPAPGFNCFQQQGCFFAWTWGGTLKANEYFQVQLVGPANAHRGIHPPTKDFSFQSNWTVYQIVTDWCDPSKYCTIKWTVAIIEWDGKDPSKIGRTIIEAVPRDVKL